MTGGDAGHELRNRARDALELHNGDIKRATAMISYLITRRVYLLDAMVSDYLTRVRESVDGNG
jgi:hypothetical protein